VALITVEQVETLERSLRVGGVALFPTDTVYGLGCDPGEDLAVRRLYAIKGRRPDKPAAVLFFDVGLALSALRDLGPRTRVAMERLLPGGVTLLLPNPARRWPLACGPDPTTLGLRVPALPDPAAALRALRFPLLQSSANLSGGADPATVDAVDPAVRSEVDVVLDAGRLPGTASTVVDLRAYEDEGTWSVLRAGAVPADVLDDALG
jgi:L-threonylcarbamoyladenylate synthase